MEAPILSYEFGKLLLEFPGWDRKQLDSVREGLICWKLKPNSGNILQAEPLLLAQWEARETFPTMKVEPDTRNFLAGYNQGRVTGPIDFKHADALYPIQVKPTSRLVASDRVILTAAPGLGKTVMALIALANRYFELAVIVVPLTSLDGWEAEIRTWLLPRLENGPHSELWVWRDKAAVTPLPEAFEGSLVVLTTPNVIAGLEGHTSPYGEGLASVFYNGSGLATFLLLDESFMYQNRKANRTDVIAELALNFRSIWLLSGMPVSKVNDDLYTQLRLLYPKTFQSYWKFVRRYCLVEDNFWGSSVVGNRPDSEELLLRDLADIVIPCEYPSGVPGWIPVHIDSPMTERQEAIYKDAKEKLFVEAKTLGRDKPLSIKRLISLTTRLLQIASNPLVLDGTDSSGKWQEFLTMLGCKDLPVLVWVKYVSTATALKEKIAVQYPNLRLGVLTGSTKPKDRYALVERFQAGELDVLILNDTVGKYSLTLTAAKVAYYLERNFDGEAYYQSLYRARRITSKHPVEIVLFRSVYQDGKETVDHLVHSALETRSENAQKLTISQLCSKI